jgi:hypothetical protein
MRTIKISAADKNAFAACEEEAGAAELNYAIGRLATWAIAGDSDRYAGDCDIWISFSESYGPELTASYHNRERARTFVLGAVFNKEDRKFSFHS